MTVYLDDIVDGLYGTGDEITTFLNRRTGDVITLSAGELEQAEVGGIDENAPQWEQEQVRSAMEVLESDEYLPLPGKYAIHEWDIMKRFAESRQDSGEQDALLHAIHGRGAFRMFRDAVERRGILDQWYRFREAAFEEIAITFLEANGIAYSREKRSE